MECTRRIWTKCSNGEKLKISWNAEKSPPGGAALSQHKRSLSLLFFCFVFLPAGNKLAQHANKSKLLSQSVTGRWPLKWPFGKQTRLRFFIFFKPATVSVSINAHFSQHAIARQACEVAILKYPDKQRAGKSLLSFLCSVSATCSQRNGSGHPSMWGFFFPSPFNWSWNDCEYL